MDIFTINVKAHEVIFRKPIGADAGVEYTVTMVDVVMVVLLKRSAGGFHNDNSDDFGQVGKIEWFLVLRCLFFQ
jgi:hypothetical protein